MPAWKRQFAKVPGYQKDFLRNMVSHLKGMPDSDRFFDGCEIPHYICRNAQEDSKIEPAEMAEYSAIEQAVSIWWLSNNKPLYWKIEHLQAGFENLNIGKFSSPCLRDIHICNLLTMTYSWICLRLIRQLHHLIHMPPISLL